MPTTLLTPAEAAARLRGRDDILIYFHRRPDGDTVGCASALCAGLRAIGKTAYVFINRDITPKLRPFVERFAVPEGFFPAYIVAVDIASKQVFPYEIEKTDIKFDLSLDHHPSNSGFARETCVSPDYAACGELIFELLPELCGELDRDMALALYLAVSTDTGCFRYSNTTAHTHRVAAALMDTGISIGRLNRSFFSAKSVARMKLESAFMDTLRLYDDGTVAVAHITPEMLRECGADSDDEEDIVGVLRAVESSNAAVLLKQLSDGSTKISLRTNETVNASRVCAFFGGGGHAQAAGCSIDADINTAEGLFLEKLRQVRDA